MLLQSSIRRIVMRMPRMQVYLPDALYREVKTRGLAASELLQAAVAEEVRRLEREAALDAYLEDLIAEVGEPTAEEQEWAEALARRIQERSRAGRAR